jgi:F0F1-type ATP synthase membrane subunit b/b'
VQVNPAGQQPGGPGQPGQIPGGPSQPGQNAQQQPGQAAGQTSPFASLPGGSAAPLFQDAGVRKTLNISEQQLNQLTQANDRLLKDYRARVGQLSNLDARDRPAALQKLWGGFQSDFSAAAGKILDQNQLGRYRQLDLQRQGLAAFNDPQLQQQLGLTEAQRQQLQTLTATRQQQMNALREMAQTNRAEATRRFEALQQEIGKQLNTILNVTQQKNWTEMTGQPHEFPLNFDLTNR